MPQSPKPKKQTGRQSQSFLLPTLEGKTISSTEYAGKWLLLVFHRHFG